MMELQAVLLLLLIQMAGIPAAGQVVRIDEQGRSYDYANNKKSDDIKLRQEYEAERHINHLAGGYGNVSGYVHIDAGNIEYDMEELRIRRECYACYYSTGGMGLKSPHGTVNCEQPFNDTGVPVIKCDHGSCGWVTEVMRPGGDELTLRGCFEECREYEDQYCTVRCCRGSRCNHFWPPNLATPGSTWNATTILSAGLVLLYGNMSI